MGADAQLIKINTILLRHLRIFSRLGCDRGTLELAADNENVSLAILPDLQGGLPKQKAGFWGYSLALCSSPEEFKAGDEEEKIYLLAEKDELHYRGVGIESGTLNFAPDLVRGLMDCVVVEMDSTTFAAIRKETFYSSQTIFYWQEKERIHYKIIDLKGELCTESIAIEMGKAVELSVLDSAVGKGHILRKDANLAKMREDIVEKLKSEKKVTLFNRESFFIMNRSLKEIGEQEEKIFKYVDDLIKMLQLPDFKTFFNKEEQKFMDELAADLQLYREKQLAAIERLKMADGVSAEDILRAFAETYSEDFMQASLKFAQVMQRIAFFEYLLKKPDYKGHLEALKKEKTGGNLIIDILLERNKKQYGSSLIVPLGPQGLIRRTSLIKEKIYDHIAENHPRAANISTMLKQARQVSDYVNQAVGKGTELARTLSIVDEDSRLLENSMKESALLAEVQRGFPGVKENLFGLSQVSHYLTSGFFSYEEVDNKECTVENFVWDLKLKIFTLNFMVENVLFFKNYIKDLQNLNSMNNSPLDVAEKLLNYIDERNEMGLLNAFTQGGSAVFKEEIPRTLSSSPKEWMIDFLMCCAFTPDKTNEFKRSINSSGNNHHLEKILIGIFSIIDVNKVNDESKKKIVVLLDSLKEHGLVDEAIFENVRKSKLEKFKHITSVVAFKKVLKEIGCLLAPEELALIKEPAQLAAIAFPLVNTIVGKVEKALGERSPEPPIETASKPLELSPDDSLVMMNETHLSGPLLAESPGLDREKSISLLREVCNDASDEGWEKKLSRTGTAQCAAEEKPKEKEDEESVVLDNGEWEKPVVASPKKLLPQTSQNPQGIWARSLCRKGTETKSLPPLPFSPIKKSG